MSGRHMEEKKHTSRIKSMGGVVRGHITVKGHGGQRTQKMIKACFYSIYRSTHKGKFHTGQ